MDESQGSDPSKKPTHCGRYVPTTLGLHTTVAATSDQVSSSVGGEIVLLGLARGEYYALRGVGALIWELIQTPRQVSEVCAAVRAHYDVDEARCVADVRAFLNDLFDHDLARVVVS